MTNTAKRASLAKLAALPALALAPDLLRAQSAYPSKPIRFLVPQAPGGGADALVRSLQPKMQEALGQTLVIDNKPGAGGNIGTTEGARAQPDGYTLVFVNLSTMAVNPYLYARPGYKVADFDPVTNMAATTNLICVNPSLPVKTMAEFIALARAKPGTLTYATAGNGSENHLMGELLKSMAGIDLPHVPYKGGGPAVIATLGGEVSAIVADPLSAISHVKSGKLRALAVTSAKRAKALPDVPTIAESGVPGYEATGWRALAVPKGTPKDIIMKIHALYEPVGNSPEEFAAFIQAENDKWGKLVKKIGLKID